MLRRNLIPLSLTLALAAIGAVVGWLLGGSDAWWPPVAGAVVGLAIGVPLGWLIGQHSGALRDGSDAQRISGLPLVAHVPPPGKTDAERRRSDEAFRMLRAALVLGPASDDSLRTVVVTSAAPGEGKTTVAAGLARALARAGRPVIAVEADLRRPGLGAALGVGTGAGAATPVGAGAARGVATLVGSPPTRGLTAAIVGGVPVGELLIEIEPGLRLLPAGELPPNAPELLGSADAARVLAELAELGAIVVLDTAPLLPVADTRELLAQDGTERVILVARPGVVRRDELRDAVALLSADHPAILAVSARAHHPRSYDRYLRDATSA